MATSKKTAKTSARKTAKREPREGSKLAKALTMYARKTGATIAEIRKATGWGPMNYGISQLRKRGYNVVSKGEGRFAL